MASTQAPNQILDLLRALKRRRYQVAVPALIVAAVGTAFAVIVPKRYKLVTRIEISDRTRIESDSRLRNPQELAVRREATAVSDHIRHYGRVKAVIEKNLAQWPEYVLLRTDAERGQFINSAVLDKNLSANPTSKDPKSGTIFVEISYSDENKERAARFLQDLSESWLVEMRDSDRNTLISERAKLQEIVDAQLRDVSDREERLYALYQLLGVDPSTSGVDTRREQPGDWVFTALDHAKTELADVDFRLTTAEFELEQAQERHEREPETNQKKVFVEGKDPADEIRERKVELADLEDQIANLRPSHSTYKRLKPKIDALSSEIEELENREPEALVRWEEEDNPLKAEYALAVRGKEDEVGRLREQQTTLGTRVEQLERETKARTGLYANLEDLRNQVNEARLTLNATSREYQDRDKSLQMLDSSPPPWRIAQPPVASSASTQPNPWFLAITSVFAGLALGIGLAVVSEFARSSYRSVADLASVMSIPVLGAIETIVTRRERRRMQVSHAVAGLSTAVIVGTIGWITYLWSASPERLPLEVQDAIERLRTALK